MKQGTCKKCGIIGEVVMHHEHGYVGENKDNVNPYCRSCHAKIHIRYRYELKCPYSSTLIARLSNNSRQRRLQKEKCKKIAFYETVMPHVRLCEDLHIYPEYTVFTSYFQATNGKKLYEINI